MGVKEYWSKTKLLTLSTKEAINQVLAIIKKYKTIYLLYIFGSRAKDIENKESDIDFAILTNPKFSLNHYLNLLRKITFALKTDRFHVVWLNRADPILAYTVIKEGKILYFVNENILNDYETKAIKNFREYSLYLKKHRLLKKN